MLGHQHSQWDPHTVALINFIHVFLPADGELGWLIATQDQAAICTHSGK